MFKQISGVILAAALVFSGANSAQAATPTAAFETFYETASLSSPAAGAVTRIVGTDLDQVTGAKFVGVSPAFGALTAAISAQTPTSLSVAIPTVAGNGTSQLFLTTASGDIEVGYFQHVGATKITSSISLRNQVPMAATARVNDPARDLSNYADVNVTNFAVGTFPVTYTTNNAAICAVVAKTLTFTGVGTCILSAQLTESNGIAASNIVTKEIVVSAAGLAQTIKAPAPNTMQTILLNMFNLNATSTSGLPVTYTSETRSVCRVVIDSILPLSLGTCTITVTQPGNATYSAATPYVYNITITEKGVPVTPAAKTSPKYPTVLTKLKAKKAFTISLNATKGSASAGANVHGLVTKIAASKASKAFCTVTAVKSKSKKIVAYSVKGLKAGKCSITVAVTGNALYKTETKTFVVTVSK
jgi:hypothetical protein